MGRLFETERVKAILDAQPNTSPAKAGLEAVIREIGQRPKSPAEAFSSVESVQIPGMSLADIRAARSKTVNGFFFGVDSARQAALYRVSQQLDPRVVAGRARAPVIGNALSELRQQYRTLSTKSRMFLTSSKDAPH